MYGFLDSQNSLSNHVLVNIENYAIHKMIFGFFIRYIILSIGYYFLIDIS